MSKKEKEAPAPAEKLFSGFAVSLDAVDRMLTRAVILEIKNGVVSEVQTISDPDLPAITMSKAESALWTVFQHLRDKFL